MFEIHQWHIMESRRVTPQVEVGRRVSARAQEMTLLAQRMDLEKRIKHGILKLLLCDLERLPATVVFQLQRDLEEWSQCPPLAPLQAS